MVFTTSIATCTLLLLFIIPPAAHKGGFFIPLWAACDFCISADVW